MERLNKLEVINANDHKGYSFSGNPSAFLSSITKNSFVISPYHDDDYVEYDFHGELIEVHTKEVGKRFWSKPIDKTNIVEIMKSDLADDYSNRCEFEKRVNYKIPSIEDSEYDKEVWLCDNIKLTRLWKWKKDDVHVLFVISSTVDNSIISTVHIDKPHYLDGDCGTRVYLFNGKHLLVDNDGDCPSVLLIKNNDLTAEPSNPIPKQVMESGINVKSYFDNYRQSIINLVYGMIDENKYGIYGGKNVSTYYVENRSMRKRIMDINIRFNTIEFTGHTMFSLNAADISYKLIEELRQFIKDAINQFDDSDYDSDSE